MQKVDSVCTLTFLRKINIPFEHSLDGGALGLGSMIGAKVFKRNSSEF